jgi:hypothetical protein
MRRVMARFRPSDKKLKELILYIAEKCADDPCFGKTKLNKILFYSDFLSYFVTGDPITGHEYMRLPHGPGPRRLKPILVEMEEAKEVRTKKERKYDLHQERVISLRKPDLEGFHLQHLDIVDQVIQALWGRTNTEVSLISHANIGWKLALPKETIPYESIFLSNRPLTEAELEYGRQLAVELGRL